MCMGNMRHNLEKKYIPFLALAVMYFFRCSNIGLIMSLEGRRYMLKVLTTSFHFLKLIYTLEYVNLK
jgi:p-aminobenzoyl-glutamate transporter AbgT